MNNQDDSNLSSLSCSLFLSIGQIIMNNNKNHNNVKSGFTVQDQERFLDIDDQQQLQQTTIVKRNYKILSLELIESLIDRFTRNCPYHHHRQQEQFLSSSSCLSQLELYINDHHSKTDLLIYLLNSLSMNKDHHYQNKKFVSLKMSIKFYDLFDAGSVISDKLFRLLRVINSITSLQVLNLTFLNYLIEPISFNHNHKEVEEKNFQIINKNVTTFKDVKDPEPESDQIYLPIIGKLKEFYFCSPNPPTLLLDSMKMFAEKNHNLIRISISTTTSSLCDENDYPNG